MTPFENLYYAIGEMAYAIARADGMLQREEKEKFSKIVAAGLRAGNHCFDISGIIFKLMDRDIYSSEVTYESAMKQIKLNSHYLSPEMKNTFMHTLEKVAKAYPPVTVEEKRMLDQFKKDMEPLVGDPVFYNRV